MAGGGWARAASSPFEESEEGQKVIEPGRVEHPLESTGKFPRFSSVDGFSNYRGRFPGPMAREHTFAPITR
jgi:hypothetical protein